MERLNAVKCLLFLITACGRTSEAKVENMAKASDLQARRRVEARVSKPNECYWSIVVVIAAHVSMASTGILRCSGITYLPWMHEFDSSGKETAAVHSFLSAPAGIAVLIGGVLTNRFGCRFTGIFAGLLMWLGLFCSYWTNGIVQLYVTAFIIGTGTGILINAASVIITLYFSKRFNVANAITIAGRGTGSMAIPPLFQHLVDSYGWRGAYLITSAIMAHMILCGVLFRHPPSGSELDTPKPATNSQEELRQLPTRTPDDDTNDDDERNGEERHDPGTPIPVLVKYADTSIRDATEYKTILPQHSNRVVAFVRRLSDETGLTIMRKSYRLTNICVLSLLYCCGYIVFPLFLVPRAETIGVAPAGAASLMSILGVGGLIGSLSNAPMISWKLSAEQVAAICSGLAGVVSLLPIAESYACLAVASFLYGFASSAFFSISHVLCRRFAGLQHFALGIGLVYACGGIGYLVAPVIAGWVFDATRSYVAVFYMLSGLHVTCAVLFLPFPLLRRIEPGLNPPNTERE